MHAAANPLPRRTLSVAVSLLLVWLLASAASVRASSHDGELYAQLSLPRGQIDFDLDMGVLHFFDAENAPFMVQVIDGCAVNGYYWILGAGLAAEGAPLTVIDDRSGQSQRIALPAFDPDEPVPIVVETEGLQLCRETRTGGLPPLTGVGTYSPASARCVASEETIELLSDGRDDAYRTLIRSAVDANRIIREKPISAVDDSRSYDELHLLIEGRTPRQLEGIVFSGREGMLPDDAALDRGLKSLTRSRVRRAYETAKSGRVPQSILEDLRLKGVECVHHISLDMETLGADAYLAQAGWIKEGGAPIAPPRLVDDRFAIEVVRADGAAVPLELTGPVVGSEQEGLVWRYDGDGVLAQVFDGCPINGAMWTVAGARTDEPLELRVTDTVTGLSSIHVLWSDRSDTAWVADAVALPACP